VTGAARRLVTGAVVARALATGLRQRPPGGRTRWQRQNFREQPVSLLAGPALAGALATASASPGAALAGLGAAAVGAYDDSVGGRDGAKGLRGHLGALARGRFTAGSAKVVGLSAVGFLAAGRTRPDRRGDALIGGAVIAGTANLLNLLDLRPGRALKVGLAAGAVLGEVGAVGACAALLPADLGERSMLGDAGANALGAVLGTALLARVPGRTGRLAVLAALAGLTAASERVSFSAVIDTTPPLRFLDQLGRRA
jgi:UDP-GlcNAc:undecaprenyl-phosphate GlcNAc-1-phosphate transferase